VSVADDSARSPLRSLGVSQKLGTRPSPGVRRTLMGLRVLRGLMCDPGAPSGRRTQGCLVHRVQPNPNHRSAVSEETASFHLGPCSPTELVTSSRPPACRLDSTSLGFLHLSTASRVRAPYEAGRPKPTSVPLSGFLNLSAVSWQRRVSRPCFVPQPPVGASFRVFPSQGSWIASRRHQLPCRCSPTCLKRAARCQPRGFTDHPTLTRPAAWIPLGLELPFHVHPKAGASRLPGPHATEPFPFRQLRRLRSLAPPASPFPPPRVSHRDRRP